MKNKASDKDNQLLEDLLKAPPSVAKKRSRKVFFVSIITIIASIVAFTASVSQIFGVSIQSVFEEPPIEDAVRIDYQYRCSGEGLIDDTITNRERIGVVFPDEKFDIVRQHFSSSDFTDASVCVHPTLSIDVVGQSRSEVIKIAPYLVVKTVSISPLSRDMKFNFFELARGSGGAYNYSSVILSPEQETTSVAYIELDPRLDQVNNKQFDFYTLAPGERESILTFFEIYPGNKYKFQIGIYYSYKGSKYVKWTTEQFEAIGTTEYIKEWKFGSSPVFLGELRTIGPSISERYKKHLSEIRKRLSKEPYFILNNVQK